MATHVAEFDTTISPARRFDDQSAWRASRLLVPVGRALFALIFLLAVPGHFTAAYAGYAARAGVPMASVAVPLTGVMILLGGLSVLLGFRTRIGAWLLILFLIPAAV